MDRSDINTLLEEGKCYACAGLTQAQIAKLALLRRGALSENASADVSLSGLLNFAKCLDGTMYEKLEFALLAQTSVVPWMRPGDWLSMPEIATGEETFVGLMAITNDDSNYNALLATGDYTVDWGDGTIDNVASGVKAEHLYDYSAIPASTETSRGYRQVLVRVTPQAGQNLTSLNLQQKHSATPLPAYSAGWLDALLNAPNLTSLTLGGATIFLAYLERATILEIGAVTNFTRLFYNCSNLQSVPLFDTSSGTNFTEMFQNCFKIASIPQFDTSSGITFTSMFFPCPSLRTIPLLDTSSGQTFTSMFQSCQSLKNVPLLDLSSATNVTSMFRSCNSLQSVPQFNLSSCTTFTDMFRLCSALQTVPLLDTGSGTIFQSMFNGCTALTSVPALDVSGGTSFTSMFSSCSNLSSAPLSGTTTAISYANCKLSHDAIVDIFNALGVASGAQTITISSNVGYASLTAPELAIATGKGWTVA